MICILILFSLQHNSSVGGAPPQSFSTVYMSPVSYNATVGSSFTVNVRIHLVAGQNISGFDVKLNYTNPQPQFVVKADNIFYSGNIFGDVNSNFVSSECVPQGHAPSIGCSTADPTDTEFGWVHFAAAPDNGNSLQGPLDQLLFSVKFQVYGTGSSLIHMNTAYIGYTGSGSFATTQSIPATTQDAIFSNSGVVAFFNYLPTDTPTVVVGHPNVFNATGSFNANRTINIVNYSWDFGDGTTGANPVIPHTFNTTGKYNVKLTVSDAEGNSNSTFRRVAVGPALGGLLLTVYSLQKVLQSGVLVRIFNASAILAFANATTDSGGLVIFNNLSPADYVLSFSGKYVKNSTAIETIIAGWTTQASVGIEVDTPPPPSPPPWYGDIIFLGSTGAAVGLFGVGLFLRRRRIQKRLGAKSSLKKR